MGCQWNGMARQMMQFDMFADSIRRSHELLVPFGIDLVDLITSDNASNQTMVSPFVSIVAVQVPEDGEEFDLAAKENDCYLAGNQIDGRVLFPATGYMVLAWKSLAKRSGKPYNQVPVVFEDVTLHRATIFPKNDPYGKLKWEDNWVTFLDTMLQFSIFSNPVRSFNLPVRIHSCKVDPAVHAKVVGAVGDQARYVAGSNALEALTDALAAQSREGGFVLLSLRTALTPAEMFLSTVGKVPFRVHSRDSVEAAFGERGFRLVGLRSDNLSALLLFRKRPATPAGAEKQAVIRVGSGGFGWVEELKAKATEYQERPAGENVWLVAEDEGTSGVVGLTNCLRQETGGDHIRCIFNASLKGGANPVANFQPASSEHKELVERDLVMNVYRDGKWGSFRHTVTQSRSQKELEFLKRRFPQLQHRNFASSQDLSFIEHILRATEGRGVDLVLNSLAEEKLLASVRCLTTHGRFLEIGKFDLSRNNGVGMATPVVDIGRMVLCRLPAPGLRRCPVPNARSSVLNPSPRPSGCLRYAAVRPDPCSPTSKSTTPGAS
ncbi:fatty acid synthase, putative [Ixodes scapularis]|uniref:Fatty acid synthase, putative n=1 Tax=Ixodes scapularis TaxID=6945 RepID=B7Q725_IXOSC|nr:fatty acid synthase, putative [Ixodes scapularis]|eukprot:XP_002403522.1 fatty acid synthase, putative [Ixodes scapularis]